MNELPTRPSKTILRNGEAQAWIDGYAFLERARARASEIDVETRRTTATAYADGFEEGRREGEAQAAELLAQTTQRVTRYLGGLDRSMAELCLQMVRRILGEFDDAELIGRCVRQALREYRHDMNVTVRVAAERVADVEALLAAVPDAPDDPAYRVEGDAQLGPGQCLLVSPVAVVDVGLDSQLTALRRALMTRTEPRR
ncbi:type III secretion system stator protein SctL [Halomonas sp. M4R5S39]|uniref:Type 3 secretion system stator protein n=1 Tax=Halomonas kalidii TaxID=3043293 RepID=A0ABT6VNU3_9GAMM|nr:type III secretion system stator protein SctL [Halomonas kalidii]MDI5935654.1 type III secretion system stator protein SctL [Halomonas kalidii]MDI5986633.1 type III secretion system stator protein SctL [Halomonas kalidii]